jgi:TonB family protein
MVRGALLLGAGILAWAGTARAEEEPAIEGVGSQSSFLRSAHDRIHPAWVDAFLHNTGQSLPASDPINRPHLTVVLAVTVIPDGTPMAAVVEKSSGVPAFDMAALELFRDTTLPQPPDGAISDDGRAHLRWQFSRHGRQCSGVTVVMRESSLEEGLPRLLTLRQDKEALRRVRAAAVAAPETAVSALARSWLARALELTVQSLPAAIGLAGANDTRGVEVLREALARGERVNEVTAALVRLKLMVPPVQHGTSPPQRAAERATSDALVRQLRAPEVTARVDAAALLAGRTDAAARQALAALAHHADPELRLFGAASLDRKARATLMTEVGPAGRHAFRTLVRGAGRGVAGEWLISQFETLTPSAQVAALSDWLWNSREASPITLSVR